MEKEEKDEEKYGESKRVKDTAIKIRDYVRLCAALNIAQRIDNATGGKERDKGAGGGVKRKGRAEAVGKKRKKKLEEGSRRAVKG